MPSEKTLTKAKSYLTDGRVKAVFVNENTADFRVMGSDAKPYIVVFNGSDWVCDCPAHVLECAHVLAVQLVCHVTATPKTLTAEHDPEIDSILGA